MTYSTATIKRARTILANASNVERNPSRATTARVIAASQARQPRKPQHKPVGRTIEATVANLPQMSHAERRAQMAGREASAGQMRRINRVYREQGLREFDSLEAFRLVFTMQSASDEYYAITWPLSHRPLFSA